MRCYNGVHLLVSSFGVTFFVQNYLFGLHPFLFSSRRQGQPYSHVDLTLYSFIRYTFRITFSALTVAQKYIDSTTHPSTSSPTSLSSTYEAKTIVRVDCFIKSLRQTPRHHHPYHWHCNGLDPSSPVCKAIPYCNPTANPMKMQNE